MYVCMYVCMYVSRGICGNYIKKEKEKEKKDSSISQAQEQSLLNPYLYCQHATPHKQALQFIHYSPRHFYIILHKKRSATLSLSL